MPCFVHTADLHLGRIFHGESLLEDQQYLIDRILDLCREIQPDALIVAGDIFDRAVPPADAMSLLDRFFLALAAMDCCVIAIPGNHDSAGRLSYASAAWESLGVHVRADFQRIRDGITVQGKNGEELDVFAFPFAETASMLRHLPEQQTPSIAGDKNQLILELLDTVREARRPGVPAILAAHEFIAGAAEAGSERIYVGGSLSVPGEYFHGFDYVALGHLHAHQHSGTDFIRYCGSPMAYSFDEAGKPKGVVVVRVGEGNLYPVFDFHEIRPLRPLAVLEGPLRRLLEDSQFNDYENSYVSARVSDGLSHLNLIGRLRERFPYLREIRQPALEATTSGTDSHDTDLRLRETPETVFTEFLDRAGWENESEIAQARKLFHEISSLLSGGEVSQ